MYDAEQIERVCELVEDDGLGVRVILRRLEMSPGQFYRTIEANPEFAERYARAKERQAEMMADDIIQISDDSGFDAKVIDGCAVIDGEAIQRARLRVDSRKWVASKLLPKKYGDRQTIALEDVNAETLLEALRKEK